jgi:hypothetical protein
MLKAITEGNPEVSLSDMTEGKSENKSEIKVEAQNIKHKPQKSDFESI